MHEVELRAELLGRLQLTPADRERAVELIDRYHAASGAHLRRRPDGAGIIIPQTFGVDQRLLILLERHQGLLTAHLGQCGS